MLNWRCDHLNPGATSLDAALAGVGAEAAAPPLARLGRDLTTADLGPQAAFRGELRLRLIALATVTTARPARALSHHPAR